MEDTPEGVTVYVSGRFGRLTACIFDTRDKKLVVCKSAIKTLMEVEIR
jgi:hypothetical protein